MRTIPHKTQAAGGVVRNGEGKILAVNQNGDSWSLPKGQIEPGEDALTAARREITEESGITNLTLIKPLSSYQRYRIGKGGVGEDKTTLVTIHMFLFRTSQSNLAPHDSENPEARWVVPDDVPSLLTHPRDKQFFEEIKFEI